MAKPRLSMRKVKEVLRLKCDCRLTDRQIARSCGIARSTVADYLYRAASAGITWPLPDSLTDTALDALLFKAIQILPSSTRPLPDCETICRELRNFKNLNLTLTQLWTEYKEMMIFPRKSGHEVRLVSFADSPFVRTVPGFCSPALNAEI